MLIQYTSGPVLAYADNNTQVVDDIKTTMKTVEKKESTVKVSSVDNKVIQLGKNSTATVNGETLELAGVFNGNTEKVPEEYMEIKPSIKKIIIKENFKIIGKSADNGYNSYNEKYKQYPSIFSYFQNVTEIENLKFLDTSEMTDMASMFYACSKLESIDLSNFNTSNVTDMEDMFAYSSNLKTIDLKSFDTKKVIKMKYMFSSLKNLESINLESFNTSNVEDMEGMFYGVSSLDTLDLRHFNTAKVKTMRYMFSSNVKLKNLYLDNFDTTSVENMESMFSGCYSLVDLNLSSFRTPNVTNMFSMFSLCTNLKNLNVSTFDTSKVIRMDSMFFGCHNLVELDLSNFDTSSAERIDGLFNGSRNLEKVNIKNFNMLKNDNRDDIDTVNIFSSANKVNTIVMGENVRFFADPKLYENKEFPYTGRWKVEEYPEIAYENSKQLTEDYNGEYPGTYYREKIEITINFDSNGGSKVNPVKVMGNDILSKPENPIKEGYEFLGWYMDKLLTNKYNFDNQVKEDFTLYAKWDKKEVPVEPVERLSDTVVLASGYKYTDVLTATVLANEKHAPILLSEVNSLTDETITEIKRINPTEIIISGGENSISKKVEDLLKTELKDITITRISGKDRYETAKNIGVKVRETSPNKTEAMLVDGTNFPDVITMSTIASEKRAPILLTQPNVLNDTTKNSLNEFKIKDIIIGGGENSVSKNIENSLEVDKNIIRYGGSDRYETASIVGNAYRNMTGKTDNLIVVDGTNFPDGITVSSLSSKIKAPILLTAPNSLPEITANDINSWKVTNTIIAGGENSVNEEIYTKLGGSKRISGKDRYETAVKISQEFLEK